MAVTLNPYINFRDSTREAMEFYKSVFGGELKLSTFKDFGAAQDPGEETLIMHSQLEADGNTGMMLMAADYPTRHGEYKPGNNFSLSLSGEDEATLKGYFDKLSAGGTVTQPLTKANWGDTFGMLVDKFGVTWLVNISAPKPA